MITTTGQAILAAAIEGDETAHHAYADWLIENGDPLGEILAAHICGPLGMRLVPILPGKFTMGNIKSDCATHEVTLTRPFCLGIFPVTVGQFRAFADAMKYDAGNGWTSPGFAQTDAHPVTHISHRDALAFCLWLSQLSGQKCRLPTEAEWEYACRAGTTTPFAFGEELSSDQANYGSHATTPVGSYAPNGWGLFDMHGNVWEWCADWYDEDYYHSSPSTDPRGPDTGSLRVLRGGGWRLSDRYCRSASRSRSAPENRHQGFGFRVVAEP